jgi:DNA (cytosine-5)-methyltransferase 1
MSALELTHFSLFSGIGGIDLAATWAGFRTVGFCERDDYCQKVLQKHWPDVPIWSDIYDVTAESVRAAGIHSINLVSGGFPCQPYSIAGKRKGADDDRFLWPEMLRVIRELKPDWVLGENVPGLIEMELDRVLFDLESADYETQAFIIPACAVGAFQTRDRIFIVANSKEQQRKTWSMLEAGNVRRSQEQPRRLFGSGMVSAGEPCNQWTKSESGLDRMVHGVSFGLDEIRTRALGNAVVPDQAYPILAGIAYIIKASSQWQTTHATVESPGVLSK